MSGGRVLKYRYGTRQSMVQGDNKKNYKKLTYAFENKKINKDHKYLAKY